MSKTIDERIVSMQFDNAHFEKNVQTSLSTLDKLKRSLNLTGASKGLENIEKAAGNVDLSSVSNSADKVGLRFSAMYTIADQALRNITNSAMIAGKRIVSSLTIDPVKMGFQEYETQMNAVQTILANTKSKGTNLDDVNGALDELNTYADKTIYNFTEMTRNIGTFTAAGVDLDTSVSAIKGIANLAAVSGSSSQQASTAMYQLSQAMASGTVKLMDWNSVVNAGMGGQVFQDALKETAKVHGIAIDDIIKKQGSFRESLSEGWLTTEILTETLSKFTGDLTEEQLKSMGYTDEQIKGILELGQTANDAATKVKTFTQLLDTLKEAAQSGWSQTWRIVFGDFEEAKEMFTKVSDTLGALIGKSAESRNAMLEDWKTLGGRDDLIDSLANAFKALMSIITPIKDAFREIFPPMTGEKLAGMTAALKEFTAKLILTDTASENLKRTFKGVFAIFSIIKKVIVALAKAIGKVLGVTDELGGGILSITAVIGDWLVALNDAIENSNIFELVIGTIAKGISAVLGVFAKLVRAFQNSVVFQSISAVVMYFIEVLSGAGDAMDSLTGKMAEIEAAWKASGLYKLLNSIWKIVKSIFKGVIDLCSGFAASIADAFGSGDFEKGFDIINGLLTGGVLAGIGVFIKKLIELFQAPNTIIESITGMFDSVGEAINSFVQNSKVDQLKGVAISIGILAAALLVLSFIDSEKIADALVAISIAFGEMLAAVMIINKVAASDPEAMLATKSTINSMITLSIGLLVLASAIRKIGELDWNTWAKGILGISVVLLALAVSQRIMQGTKGNAKEIKKASKNLIILCFAMRIVAKAVETFGNMQMGSLAQGVIGMTAVLAALSGSLIAMIRISKYSKVEKFEASAKAIMIMSAAMLLITPSLLVLGRLPLTKVIQGVVAMAAILAVLSTVSILMKKFAGSAKGMTTAAASLLIMAEVINLILPAIVILGLLPMHMALQGALALVSVLSALALAQIALTRLGGTGGKMNAAAASLLIMALAIDMITPTLVLLGVLPLALVLKSVIAFTAILTVLTGAMILLSKLGGGGPALIMTANSVMTMAQSLLLLTVVLTALALLPIVLIAKGLVTIAAAFAILGVSALVLAPLTPIIRLLSAAMLTLGKAMVLIGAGTILFGAGLSVLAAGLIALFTSLTIIAGSLSLLCNVIVELVAALIEGIILGIGRGIVALIQVLSDSTDAIFNFIKVLIIGLCDVLRECVPEIVDVILEIVAELCKSLARFIPIIVDALVEMLTNILKSLAEKLPGLIKAAVDVLFAFIKGVIEAFGGMDPGPLLECLRNIGIIAAIMAALAAMALLTPGAMVGVVGMGLVIAELSIMLAAIGALSKIPGLMWLVEKGGDVLEAVGTAVGRLIGGIAGGIAKGMSSALPEVGTNLSAFMTNAQPFIEGAKNLTPEVISGTKGLVEILYALIGANIIEGLTKWFTGGSSLVKFGEDLASFGPNFRAYADSVNGIDTAAVESSVNAAKMLSDLANNLPNDGGVMGWFAGENNIGDFGKSLVNFGIGMKRYAESVTGIDTGAITASATAGKSLAELANSLPNIGGLAGFFSGDADLGSFGTSLIPFGKGLKGYAESVAGIDAEAVRSSAEAAKGVVEMTNMVPNQGGLAAWFTGEQSLSKYGRDLISLGRGLAGFAIATMGINPTALAATATAAKALAEMTNMIPNSDGVVSWFTGEQSISKFGNDLVSLGTGLKGFATQTAGVDIEAMTGAANAAKILAEMTQHIPSSDGIASWFGGEQSISKFGSDLIALGAGLKGFATETAEINPESVTAAANAAKTLAEMTKAIPEQDGVFAWFSGEQSISKFGSDLIALGKGLKGFATETAELNPESVTAAAGAAKTLAEMTKSVPTEGGVKAWFTGEQSLSKFSGELPKLGEGLKGFSTSTAGINPENMTAAANAAKALAEMTKNVPTEGGIKAWFTGKTSISEFADKLPGLGKGLKGFSDSVAGINPENLTAASSAAKSIAEMCKTALPNVDKIPDLATNLKTLGISMKSCFVNLGGITAESITAANNAISSVEKMNNVNSSNIGNVASSIKEATEAIKNLSTVPANIADNFNNALSTMGKTSAEGLLNAFKNIEADMKTAGETVMNSFIKGVEGKKTVAENACKAITTACTTAIKGKKDSFYNAGSDLVSGFASGISENSFRAEAKAAAMAAAAVEAAKEELDINSPSKVFRAMGYSVPEGFAMGIDKLSGMAADSSVEMADRSIDNVRSAMSRIADVINSDVDSQPTIRPVLDLSDVRAGANSIGGLFGSKASVGVLTRVNSLNASMNQRIQNGDSAAVVDGINKLNKQLKDMDFANYSINGVNLAGNSEVEAAFETILRAAKIERRR